MSFKVNAADLLCLYMHKVHGKKIGVKNSLAAISAARSEMPELGEDELRRFMELSDFVTSNPPNGDGVIDAVIELLSFNPLYDVGQIKKVDAISWFVSSDSAIQHRAATSERSFNSLVNAADAGLSTIIGATFGGSMSSRGEHGAFAYTDIPWDQLEPGNTTIFSAHCSTHSICGVVEALAMFSYYSSGRVI